MIAYAVTDPSTLDFNHLDSDLQRFSQKASMIVYRDKANADYDVKAIDFVEVAKRLDFEKVLVHGDRILAETVKADGVHLASTQLDTIPDAKARNLFVVVSTHSLKEVQEAEALGADMVTFSPIFSTPNKGKAVGLEALKNIISEIKIPLIALGGILTQEQIRACQNAGAKGFASIRYFA